MSALPKPYRLTKESDIKRLFSKGKGVHDTHVGVRLRPNDAGVSRFVFVVGTKVHKRAIRRNLLRRRMRHVVYTHLSHMRPGFDVAVMAKSPALGATYAELEQSVLNALKKAKLLTPVQPL